MKRIGFIIVILSISVQCSKEKRFENGIHGKWNIDRVRTYDVYDPACGGQGATLISESENTGTIELTDEKYPDKVAYSTTDQQYIGYWTDANGSEKEFVYEYFSKLDDTFSLTFFINGNVNIGIQILTKKEWHFRTNNYFGGCQYNATSYILTK